MITSNCKVQSVIICTSNDGFEDQLTEGKKYYAGIRVNSFLITNDKGKCRYYGQHRFNVVGWRTIRIK